MTDLQTKIIKAMQDLKGDIVIADDPKNRRYAFVKEDSTEALSLTISELKYMGKDIFQYFQAQEKDVKAIVSALGHWVQSQNPPDTIIKPCPFCESALTIIKNNDVYHPRVECLGCGATGPVDSHICDAFHGRSSVTATIAAWNVAWDKRS